MKAAFGNYTYALYTLDYFLAAMQRFGVRYIELWGAAPHFHLDDRTPAEATALGRRLRALGLQPVCFTPEQCTYPVNVASEDEALRRRSIALFEKAIRYAPLLGAPAVLVTPGQGSRNLPVAEARQRSRQALSHLARLAQSQGVALYLEHLTRTTTNLVVTMADMARYLREVDEPNLLPMADLDMMAREGEGVEDFAAALGRLPAHLHLVDGMPGGHLAPGDGVLPLARQVQWLRQQGYGGYATLEVLHERYLHSPDEAVRRCLGWLQTAGIPAGEAATT